jgi:hypothetical protein
MRTTEFPLLKQPVRVITKASKSNYALGCSWVMLTMPENRRIDPSWLPVTALSQVEFLDSSFFQLHGPNQPLPTPAEVKALSGAGLMRSRPPPVRFESLGLIVKFGYHVTIYEAQCLQVIKRVFNDEIPVPEVYGWRVHDNQVFIYMQLIQGEALIDRWDSLSISDKTVICDQLHGIVTSLRSVEQNPDDMFVGVLWNP